MLQQVKQSSLMRQPTVNLSERVLTDDNFNSSVQTSETRCMPKKGRGKSKAHRRKISRALKGRKFSEQHKANMRAARARLDLTGANNPFFGKTHTPESRQKIREARTGTKQSEETKKKRSKVMQGENNPNFGKPRSEKTRDKISATRKLKSQEIARKSRELHRRRLAAKMKTADKLIQDSESIPGVDKGLLLAARHGDNVAFGQLLDQFTKIINRLIHKYSRKGLDRDTAYSVAIITFWRAILNYSRINESSFAHYIYVSIENNLRRELSKTVKVNKHEYSLDAKIDEFGDRLRILEDVSTPC